MIWKKDSSKIPEKNKALRGLGNMEGFVRQVYLEGLSMFNTTLDIQD